MKATRNRIEEERRRKGERRKKKKVMKERAREGRGKDETEAA